MSIKQELQNQHESYKMSPHTQATDNWKWTGQICLHQSFSPEMDGNFEVGLLLVSICCALACIASNLGVCKVTPLGWKQDCGVDLMPFTASGETRVWISEPDISKHHHSPCTGWGGMRVINDSMRQKSNGDEASGCDCRSTWALLSLRNMVRIATSIISKKAR